MPTNINYPLEFPIVQPNHWSLNVVFDNRRNDNPFSFTHRRVSGNGGAMSLALNFAPLVPSDGGDDMRVFLSQLRGRYGTFKFSLGRLTGDTSGTQYKPNQSDKAYAEPDVVGGWFKWDTAPSYNMSGSMLSLYDGKPLVIIGENDNKVYYWPPYRMDDANINLNKTNPIGLWRLSTDEPMWSYRNDGKLDVAIAATSVGLRESET